MFFNVFQSPQRDACLVFVGVLRDRPHEELRQRQRHVRRQVGRRLSDILVDPLGQLCAFVCSCKSLEKEKGRDQSGNTHQMCGHAAHLVRKHHESPVGLTTQDASDTLRRITHGVEPEELGLPNPVRVTEVF